MATINIPVNSPAFQFSPGNWKGDTGRGGSVYRQTWNVGAWFKFQFNASSSPTATLLLPSTSTGVNLAIFVNGVLTNNVAATGNVTINNLVANATNNITVYIENSPQTSRWNNGTNTLQVQGMQIDSASTAGTVTPNPKWGLIVGDSITEGIQANAGAASFTMDYSFYVTQALDKLGYDVGINACGYSGWLRPGDSGGDVPAYYLVSSGTYSDAGSRWNKIDQGVSILDSNGQISAYGSTNTTPSFIFINYGTNEMINGSSSTDLITAIQGCLTALRAAAPNAWLLMCVPFGMYYNSSTYPTYIKQGFNNYQAANPVDNKVALLDLGAGFSSMLNNSQYMNPGNVHPLQMGHALIAPAVASFIHQHVSGNANALTFKRGFW
jgi:hypothetical protein